MKDLTVGSPIKVLWKYLLPMFGSVFFQQMYNIADSVVAGKFLGTNALAAVGNSYEITFVYLAFAFGCNIGASLVIANFVGEKKFTELKTAVNTTVIVTMSTCAVLMLVGLLAGGSLLTLLNTPSEIYADSLLYLDIYTGGLAFTFIYNITTGIFAAMGDSVTPFIFLVVSSLANIGMDVLFVVSFNMGVAGVAWATFICQGASGITAFIVLLVQLKKIKTERKPKVFSKDIFKEFLRLAVPSTLQQSFISIGNIAIQGLINGYGTATIAGYSAALKFNNFSISSVVTVGNGLSNYVSQNIGAKKTDRIKKGIPAGFTITFGICLVFILLYELAGEKIMLLFLNESDTEAIGVGALFLRILSPFYLLASTKIIADSVLKGAGRMGMFMIGTFIDLIARVGFSFLFSYLFGSEGIWWSWSVGWLLGAICSWIFYFGKRWAQPKKSLRKSAETAETPQNA